MEVTESCLWRDQFADLYNPVTLALDIDKLADLWIVILVNQIKVLSAALFGMVNDVAYLINHESLFQGVLAAYAVAENDSHSFK
jgi:hypothetical protein